MTLELPKLEKQENKVTKVNISSGSNKNLGQASAESTQTNGSSSSDSSNGGASDISAKEEINTHGSGEPSAENVEVKTESQAAAN